MDSFNETRVERITICAATQVGKTEALLNCLGYLIHRDPGPTLYVFPTVELAEFSSRNRIQPMIEAIDVLRERKSPVHDEFKLLEMRFYGMVLTLAGANSPASLASRPCRYIFLDETDKYPLSIREEASPIELAIERAKTYWDRKIMEVSTPTVETGNIWRSFQAADEVCRFHVACPYCGHMQVLRFEQLKWPQELDDPAEAEGTTWYECERCKQPIRDLHKPAMLLSGRWLPDRKRHGIRRHIAFHLPTFYSPWVSFGEIATKFLKAKNYPEQLQNFVNSWLAEPWREDYSNLQQHEAIAELEERMLPYERGTVPKEAVLLTAGVDVQEQGFYFVLRAWAPDLTSWLVWEGFIDTWEGLEAVLFERRYLTEDGEMMTVELACIDSGHRADEVYRFCNAHPGVTRAVKGASHDMRGRPYQPPSKESRSQLGWGAPWIVNTAYYKDFIVRRQRIAPGLPGAWYIYQGVSQEYLRHMTSEVRIQERGRVKWVKRSSHAQNHLWDAEVYATIAQDMYGIRARPGTSERPPKRDEARGNRPSRRAYAGWLERRSGWLR